MSLFVAQLGLPVSVLPLVCESCTAPIPACTDGEFLTVDLNTTDYCCPQYSCGKYFFNILKYLNMPDISEAECILVVLLCQTLVEF